MEKNVSLFDQGLQKQEVRSENRRAAMLVSNSVGIEMAKNAFKELENEYRELEKNSEQQLDNAWCLSF